jgi:hypothetical protein
MPPGSAWKSGVPTFDPDGVREDIAHFAPAGGLEESEIVAFAHADRQGCLGPAACGPVRRCRAGMKA